MEQHIILYMLLQKWKIFVTSAAEADSSGDDKPETVLKRLGVYHEQTQPLVDYYTQAGILKEVDGTIDIDDVFAAIVKILGE